MCAMWTPSSDASGTATTGTELLYEPKQASVTPSLVDTGKNEVTLKITPGRAIIKLDADLLSMYSPVLKDELQRRLQGGTEQRASFIRVSGDEVSWRTIKSMLLGQYDMNHESNMDLFDIARTLLIATTYELEIVKDVLVQEIFKGYINDQPERARRIVKESSITAPESDTLRWIALGEMMYADGFSLDQPPANLWKTIKSSYMQAGELAARARCVAHLLELSSIMKNQVITVCNSGQCYWVDSHGTRQYGMSSSVEDKLEKKDFGAWVIWNRAADSVAACVNNTHVPAVSLALKEVQREILEPPCCTQCDTELRTLLRVVTGIAAERKLL